MKKYITFFTIIIFYSCSADKTNNLSIKSNAITVDLRENTILCDTCISELLISHDECTDCSDLHVDSGIIFIPNSIFRICDSLVTNDTLISKHADNKGHLYLNTQDLRLTNKDIFYKLWPDTINWKDFNKKYIVKGKITDVAVERRMGFNVIVPKFQVDTYSLINTAD